MRIGTFLLILLVATVALGFLLSDTIHLREDLEGQRRENQRLAQALEQTEQEKQNALTTLQSTSQNLVSCQQKVEQAKGIINQLTSENSSLKSHNQQLESVLQTSAQGSSTKTDPATIDATTVSFASFIALGFLSATFFGLKYLQRQFIFKGHSATGQYVFLSNAELAELVRRRRSEG